MARPNTSNSHAFYIDHATDVNTAILAESSKAENLSKHRALCRANGVHDGPQELRRLQHFVSQAIIRLLTHFNITQKDGRPYISSCPKGFLQGPDIWLLNCGFYLSGWPRGLPSGSISIWPSHYTFALAAMFINNSITLKPLGQAPEIKRRIEELAALPRPPKKSKYQKKDPKEKPSSGKNRASAGDEVSKQSPVNGRVWAGQPLLNEFPAQMHANVRLVAPVAIRAVSVESEEGYGRQRKEYLTDDDLDAEGSLDDSLISIPSTSISAPAAYPRKRMAEDIYPQQQHQQRQQLQSHQQQQHQQQYFSTPRDATVDWIPPVSAARDVKRMKISV